MSDLKNTKEKSTNSAVSKSTNDSKATTKAIKAKVNEQLAVSPALDKLYWLIAIVLIVAAIGGNFYYVRNFAVDEGSLSRLLRVAIVIVVIVAGLATTLLTNRGRRLLSFTREAYVELRKVVWPTRQESVQTTVIVFIAVCLVSLFLYLCDIVFLQLVRAITL